MLKKNITKKIKKEVNYFIVVGKESDYLYLRKLMEKLKTINFTESHNRTAVRNDAYIHIDIKNKEYRLTEYPLNTTSYRFVINNDLDFQNIEVKLNERILPNFNLTLQKWRRELNEVGGKSQLSEEALESLIKVLKPYLNEVHRKKNLK